MPPIAAKLLPGVLLLLACIAVPASADEQSAAATAAGAATDSQYRLSAGDKLNIIVFGQRA